jgi:hypothetical protein
MRSLSVLASVLLCALSGGAAMLAAQSEPERNPILVRVDIPHGNILGPHYFTSVLLLVGGAVTTSSSCGLPDRPDYLESTVGLVEPALYAQLQQVLSAEKVGQQSGSCGNTPPGGPTRYYVTWFGRSGRVSTFSLGAFPFDCPAGQRRILDAILAALASQKTVPGPVSFGDFISACP